MGTTYVIHLPQRGQSKMTHTCIEQANKTKVRPCQKHVKGNCWAFAPWKESFWRRNCTILRFKSLNFIENSILVCLYSTLIANTVGNTVGDTFEPCNSTVYLWQNWWYWMYFLCFLNVIVVQIDSPALVSKRQYLIHLCIHGAGKPHVISWVITACITILLLAKMNQWWFGIFLQS